MLRSPSTAVQQQRRGFLAALALATAGLPNVANAGIYPHISNSQAMIPSPDSCKGHMQSRECSEFGMMSYVQVLAGMAHQVHKALVHWGTKEMSAGGKHYCESLTA